MELHGTTELSKKELKTIDGGISGLWRVTVGYLVSEILNGLQQDCDDVQCR